MKVKNPSTGNFEEVYIKALDSLPVGTEVDFAGSASDIPVGWEQTNNDELYYKNGDVYSISHQYYAGGCLTGSSKEIMFTISLPKRLTNITSVAINGVNIAARMIDGTYGINGSVSDVSVADFGDNYVSIDVKSSTAIGTNNTPVSVYIRSLTLTFTASS